MTKLTHIQRIRFSDNDIELIAKLKAIGVNHNRFIRQAFREKVESDLKALIIEKEKNKFDQNPF